MYFTLRVTGINIYPKVGIRVTKRRSITKTGIII